MEEEEDEAELGIMEEVVVRVDLDSLLTNSSNRSRTASESMM